MSVKLRYPTDINLIKFNKYLSWLNNKETPLIKHIINSSTNSIQFNTNVSAPIKLTINFKPTQSGSGIPSPTNKRLITGYTQSILSINTNTLNINWESHGKIYYGKLIINEDKTVELKKLSTSVLIKNLNFSYYSRGYFRTTTLSDCLIANQASIAPYLLCSCYNIAAFNNLPDLSIGISKTPRICIKDSRYSNVSSWQNEVGNETIIYPLATPLTYTLDSIQDLSSIIGDNNISIDLNSSLSIEYYDII